MDGDDNIWATDTGSHIVVKMSPKGRVLMVLGIKGNAGEWHQAGHLRCFNEPNDLAFGRATAKSTSRRGTAKASPACSSSTRTGISSAPGAGREAARGNSMFRTRSSPTPRVSLYIADRSNQRIQVFDPDGKYLRESSHPGTPCGLCLCRDQKHIMMAHGHAGRIMKLDLNCKVLGASGGQGKGPHQDGEAHFLALDRKENIYVADTLNWRVQKLVKK